MYVGFQISQRENMHNQLCPFAIIRLYRYTGITAPVASEQKGKFSSTNLSVQYGISEVSFKELFQLQPVGPITSYSMIQVTVAY